MADVLQKLKAGTQIDKLELMTKTKLEQQLISVIGEVTDLQKELNEAVDLNRQKDKLIESIKQELTVVLQVVEDCKKQLSATTNLDRTFNLPIMQGKIPSPQEIKQADGTSGSANMPVAIWKQEQVFQGRLERGSVVRIVPPEMSFPVRDAQGREIPVKDVSVSDDYKKYEPPRSARVLTPQQQQAMLAEQHRQRLLLQQQQQQQQSGGFLGGLFGGKKEQPQQLTNEQRLAQMRQQGIVVAGPELMQLAPEQGPSEDQVADQQTKGRTAETQRHIATTAGLAFWEWEWLRWAAEKKTWAPIPGENASAKRIKFEDMGTTLGFRVRAVYGAEFGPWTVRPIGQIPVEPELQQRITQALKSSAYEIQCVRKISRVQGLPITLRLRKDAFVIVKSSSQEDTYRWTEVQEIGKPAVTPKMTEDEKKLVECEFTIAFKDGNMYRFAGRTNEDRNEIILFLRSYLREFLKANL